MPIAIIRYFLQTIKTFRVLLKRQPSIVFVTTPPIFSALVVFIYASFFGATFIIDSHTGSFHGEWRLLLFLHKFLSRRALTTIVTNDYLKTIVASWGARVNVIGDVVMSFPRLRPRCLSHKFNLVFVNTFSSDEPLENLLLAVSCLPQVQLYVTGNLKHDRSQLSDRYPLNNVIFTDFLSNEDYLRLLKSADAVIVLTTRDHTMQRGAYEALSLNKPIVTSDWQILKETFYKGTIHVANDKEGIKKGILDLIAKKSELDEEILELRSERETIYEAAIRDIKKLLDPKNMVTQ
jgi:glycosyltransferase involved in cell wall biosynthesis